MLSLGQKAGNGRALLTLLYWQPYITANEVATHLDVTHQTAISLIRDFMHLGLMEETTGYKRNRRFLYCRNTNGADWVCRIAFELPTS